MICAGCGTQLGSDARFCPACGQAMAATRSQTGMAAASPDLVGREIAGRYRILAKLGEGGMGAVYRGEQISLKRPVAVKVLRAELSANPMLLRRFNAEAEVIARISHPNTVNIYDFGQDADGSLFIAMELIEGRSLRSVVQQEAPLPPHRALHVAAQVAASLADAHAHAIVHRDLKPDNVMLQDRGRQHDVVRVLDFGIAKLRDDSRQTQQAMTQAGDMLGTPQYMAPEQIRGDAVDGRADIYALGCMLYEMVTGRMPFDAPTVMAMLSRHLLEQPAPPSARRPDLGLPPALDRLVLAAMQKDPASRPPTMEQYGEQIAALLASLPAPPGQASGARAAQASGAHPPSAPASTPIPPSLYAAPAAPGGQLAPPAAGPTPAGGFVSPAPSAGYASPPPSAGYASPPPSAGYASPAPGGGYPSPAPGVAAAAQGTPAPIGSPFAPVAMHHAGAPALARRSRAPLYLVLALLVLGGGGVAVWRLAGRGAAAAPADAGATDAASPTPSAGKRDPWATGTRPAAPSSSGSKPDPWGSP